MFSICSQPLSYLGVEFGFPVQSCRVLWIEWVGVIHHLLPTGQKSQRSNLQVHHLQKKDTRSIKANSRPGFWSWRSRLQDLSFSLRGLNTNCLPQIPTFWPFCPRTCLNLECSWTTRQGLCLCPPHSPPGRKKSRVILSFQSLFVFPCVLIVNCMSQSLILWSQVQSKVELFIQRSMLTGLGGYLLIYIRFPKHCFAANWQTANFSLNPAREIFRRRESRRKKWLQHIGKAREFCRLGIHEKRKRGLCLGSLPDDTNEKRTSCERQKPFSLCK